MTTTAPLTLAGRCKTSHCSQREAVTGQCSYPRLTMGNNRNWTGGTGYIPIGGPVPVESSATDSFSLSVECNDCRAFGSILTDFNDDAGLIMSLTFNDVGVLMDFGVFANQGGTFTIGLGRFFGDTPAGQNVRALFFICQGRRAHCAYLRSRKSSAPPLASVSTSSCRSPAASPPPVASRLRFRTRSKSALCYSCRTRRTS